ncbi:MAG: bifunctional demethylmenaquinone methyltransferase/2-methoxy-6-polyprenyl-1,4-benzoquinol methylase UbiE [Pirellulales bacterium]
MPVDKSETRVRRMFGEIAPRYDFLNHLLSLNVDKYWRRQTVRRVTPVGDAPLLDLCTGTGDLALAYARRTQAPIVAADFCPEMLTIGRQKAARAGVGDQIVFVEADAQRLPFGDDQFQIVAVAFGLRNVTNTDQGLREMVRVCRPGGKVAVLEFTTPRYWPLAGVYRWYFRRVLPRIGQAFSRNGSGAYVYLPESVGEFPCYEVLADRMRQAGLDDVYFMPLTFGVATLYVGAKPIRSRRERSSGSRTTDATPVPEPAA